LTLSYILTPTLTLTITLTITPTITITLTMILILILGIADIPKPEALLAIRALRHMGMDIWMVTGDNKTTAEAIADEFDILKDRVVSGAMPQGKSILTLTL
jgi:P-type E1-E2 ATPase